MFELKNAPIQGLDLKRVTSPFGMRKHPITGENKLHTGIDLGYISGTYVRAVAKGKVVLSLLDKGAGNIIVLYHDGWYSCYEHLSVRAKQKGQYTEAGEIIGQVGNTGNSTGAHLHFGLCTTFNYNAWSKSGWVDPFPFLKKVEGDDMTEAEVRAIVNKCLKERDNMATSANYIKDIEWAKNNGILSGDGKGNYMPQGFATRQQVLAFIHRAIDKFMK